MKIVNKTTWRTDHLRAFAARIADREITSRDVRKRLTVTFVHSRSRGASGHAGGGYVTVRVPRPGRRSTIKADLAMVLAHEFHHVETGRSGRSVEIHWRRSVRYGWHPDRHEYYAWANELPLEQKPPKAAPPKPTGVDKAARELVRLAKLIAGWESKRKRAESALKKYRAKRRYYEKRLAALKPTVE